MTDFAAKHLGHAHHFVRLAPTIGQVVVFVVASLSLLLNPVITHAGQLTRRAMTASSSKVSDPVILDSSFRVTLNTEIEGIVVQFCTNTPLIGLACTNTSGMSSTPMSPATITVTQDGNAVMYDVDAASNGSNLVVLTNTTGITPTNIASQPLTFSFSGINPSVVGTHYVRFFTFATVADAVAYTDVAPGAYIDAGGIALATSSQLTINARVQEILQFCVGTIDAATDNDCTDISGTTVDLGTVDSTAVVTSGDFAGKAMLRTNAVNGVQIAYYAEQATSGTNHLGALRVPGGSCSGNGIAGSGGAVTVDPCFNSQGTTAGPFAVGTEAFGMTASSVDTSNGTTTNLVRTANYDNDTEYAWDASGSTDIIATALSVVDDELVYLKFAAIAGGATPTGNYTVKAIFIATGTF